MTDIVDPTPTARTLGDNAWKQRLAAHNRAVRRQVERYRGREVDTTGDGFLAIFYSAGAALLAALAVRDATRDMGIAIRVGVHTGEIAILADGVRDFASTPPPASWPPRDPSRSVPPQSLALLPRGRTALRGSRPSHTQGAGDTLQLFGVGQEASPLPAGECAAQAAESASSAG